MASVEFRPGDTLNIVWTSTQNTPLGVREVESSFAFSYDELLSKLRTDASGHKSRRSGTDGARFSRVVALSTNALRKGKWSTGADIDRDEVFEKMMAKFSELESFEYENITPNARRALSKLQEQRSHLSPKQSEDLNLMIKAISAD